MEFTSDFINSMTKLANESFFLKYDAEPVVYPRLFQVKTIAEMGGMNYGMGTTIIGDDEPEEIGFVENHKFFDIGEGWAYRWSTKLFQRGFEVTQEMLDNWNNNPKLAENFVSERSAALGERFAQRRDRHCANVFNRGAITAGDPRYFDGSKGNLQPDPNRGFIYDGLPFFDTAHPLKRASGTTFSNHNAALDLTEPNIETALVQMEVSNARDELNREMEFSADTLLINPTKEFSAAKIMKSAQLPGSGNNDINPVQGRLNVVRWKKLTDTDAWFLGKAKAGLMFIHRGEPESKQKYDEFKGRGVLSFSMIDEWGTVVTDWHYWLANNIAAA